MIVELDRGALPVPADRVYYVKVYLRTVKITFALCDDIGLTSSIERLLELLFGLVPSFGISEERLRPR